jgi:hypothetical protein
LSVRFSLGGALFLAVLAATLATALLVVRARDPDLALEAWRVAREFDPEEGPIGISFFLRESEPDAFVGIVDEDGEPVRTLDPDADLEQDEEAAYSWDGTNDRGSPVAPASYFLRVELPSRDRDMVWPRRIRVLPVSDPGAQAAE